MVTRGYDVTGSVLDIPVAAGVVIQAEVTGSGPPLLLVHGWPHTRALWARMTPALSATRRVIAPDLRGTGGSTRTSAGCDAASMADDLRRVLDATGADQADVVAIDAGVPPAFLLALTAPERVRRLVLVEATLGRLPGAEAFFAAGAPWWFGFHQVPGLAESVLVGHEAEYLDFFYRSGTHNGRGIDPAVRHAFVSAYSGADSLRSGLGTYRAMAQSADQLARAVATERLRVPTLAVGAHPVGDALRRQLMPVTDDLRGELLADCGHIVPLDRPEALLGLLADFL
jgi:pimeloyl-ACP methyl ester carboxylesterase